MLKRDKEALDQMEMTFPGMWKSILAREEAKYPACPDDRRPGRYFCNTCEKFFD